MENQLSTTEQKLIAVIKYAPLGIAEINEEGTLNQLNILGEILLNPVLSANNLTADNMFPILEHIAAPLVDRIKNFHENNGVIVMNEIYSFMQPTEAGPQERFFNFIISKIFPECIMVSFEDITEKHLKEKAMIQAEMEKAVGQGMFEIASGVLHDIGNAVVGFGSYLTRIRRLLEQSSVDNVQNLAAFVAGQQSNIAKALGEEKANAMVDMLSGIAHTQKQGQEEIRKSITEQLNIVTHIQEILNIQRQYVSGQETQERKPVNLRSIINDCMAMLFASFDKRGIAISLQIPIDLPIIKGDRTKLMQVVLNVLKNSIDAIDINATEKNIAIRAYSHPDKLLLQIQDSGSGFDEDTAKHFFERGFTTKLSGSGLGLYNCKTIIESHAGKMELSSEGPGSGATTTIEFNI